MKIENEKKNAYVMKLINGRYEKENVLTDFFLLKDEWMEVEKKIGAQMEKFNCLLFVLIWERG